MQNKSNTTKSKKIKKHHKNSHQSAKFRKNGTYSLIIVEPAARAPPETEQKKKIVTNNDKITKTINKNIEKTMLQRAEIGKEKFKFLKKP
jgi:hypothetical protein